MKKKKKEFVSKCHGAKVIVEIWKSKRKRKIYFCQKCDQPCEVEEREKELRFLRRSLNEKEEISKTERE